MCWYQKWILKNKKYIILIHFQAKSILKSNHYYALKHPPKEIYRWRTIAKTAWNRVAIKYQWLEASILFLRALMIDSKPQYFWNLNQFWHLDKQKVLCYNALHLLVDRYELETLVCVFFRITTIRKKFDPIIIKFRK